MHRVNKYTHINIFINIFDYKYIYLQKIFLCITCSRLLGDVLAALGGDVSENSGGMDGILGENVDVEMAILKSREIYHVEV